MTNSPFGRVGENNIGTPKMRINLILDNLLRSATLYSEKSTGGDIRHFVLIKKNQTKIFIL